MTETGVDPRSTTSSSTESVGSSGASYAEYKSRRTFGSLDGFRCISILAVIWHHARGDLQLGRIGERGFVGVDMFFVLSGFLIVTLLLRERERGGDISLRAFYARRSLRIMPLYYGVVLGSALLFIGLRPDGSTATDIREGLPYLLTYTTNWVEVAGILSITWSLSAEEQFYLVWPPVQKYARRAVWVLIGLIVLSQAINFRLLDPALAKLGVGPDDLPMLRESTFTPILFGVLLAYGLNDRAWFDRLSKVLGYRFAPVVLVLLLMLALEILPGDLRGWPRLVIHVIMVALLASAVLREDHALAPLLRWGPIVRIGVLSYGMYLLHMFVEHYTTKLGDRGLPVILQFPLAVLGTYIVAEVSYRYYETPFLRLKKRFAR